MKTKVIERKWITGFSQVDMKTIEYEPPTIGWASVGQVPVQVARDFAQSILKACDDAENDNFDY